MNARDGRSPSERTLTTNKPTTLEEQLAEARAEIERLERRLRAKDTAIAFWLRHYLALHDGGSCQSCR